METKAALGAAGGIALTIAGATSALLLTVGQGSPPENGGAPAAVVTEYVDQFGNPIDPVSVSPATPEVIITTGVDTQVEPMPVDAMPADAYSEAEEYEEAEYAGEEAEYEGKEGVDHEETEYEDEEADHKDGEEDDD
jgi:hypothetical protein